MDIYINEGLVESLDIVVGHRIHTYIVMFYSCVYIIIYMVIL